MNRDQRLGLIGAATVAAAFLAVMLVTVAASGRDAPRRAGPGPDSSALAASAGSLASVTTMDLAPVPVGTTTTAASAPVAVATTVPPPTTTTLAPPPSVGAKGAFLVPPGSTNIRSADPLNCAAVADGPQWSTSCGVAHPPSGDLMWAIESMPVPGGTAWHVYTLRHLQGYQWAVALAAADETGQQHWTAVHAVAVDVTGDGSQDLVFGFHYPEPGASVVVDVVSGTGRVNLQRWYVEGAVQLVPGEIDAWGAGPGGVGYGHEVLRYLSGTWRIVSSVPAPPVIPPGSV
jgi:hypothetical protein